MSNEIGFKERLLQIKQWMPDIIESVKKDLRNEHLKKDYNFAKKYFPGKNINKLENSELVDAYIKAVSDEEAAEALAEFVVQHWIFRNSEVYNFFEERLSKINPDFTQIQELKDDEAKELDKAASLEFGARRTFIFAHLNGVAFSAAYLKKMEEAASKEKVETGKNAIEEAEKRSIEDMKSSHEREISRLTDKYEKKLLGFQKKYALDTEMLKKQLANLQRKLAGV